MIIKGKITDQNLNTIFCHTRLKSLLLTVTEADKKFSQSIFSYCSIRFSHVFQKVSLSLEISM